MTREELNQMRILRAEIERDIRELRGLEKKERSAAQYGQSLLRSLKRIDPANGVDVAKTKLIHTITNNQRKYLAMRAELEDKISGHLPTIISTEKTPQELVEIDEATGSRIIEVAGGNVYSIGRDQKRNFRLRGVVCV